ncbi:hypothetical protein DRO66_07150 [Candidatus Bathyarchaeota archaeon]|nr:MAG: hypothetical protein DRO66_07150 [Candidatus Bathyarchaeota archaeon]
MSAPAAEHYAKIYGKTVDEVEAIWALAKAAVKKKYHIDEKSGENFFGLTMLGFKAVLGIGTEDSMASRKRAILEANKDD